MCAMGAGCVPVSTEAVADVPVLLGAAVAVDMKKSIASGTPDRRATRGTPVAAALVASAALMVMSTMAATALCAWLTPP